jgi:molybdenum cofactor biosynthesis enzyme MoaA
MRIQTFTIVAGSEACNAHCPYCVSRMTPAYDLGKSLPAVNWRNFRIGCQFARNSGVSTVLITGKGEPTLFPDRITEYLRELKPFGFPFQELQTNGIAIAYGRPVQEKHLQDWHDNGLTLIAISIVHWRKERNQEIYLPEGPEYFDLPALIERFHATGFSVRLSCIMAKGYIDSPEGIDELVQFARQHRVEQLTVCPVNKPQQSSDTEAAKWVREHALAKETIVKMRKHLDAKGARLMELAHGAIVYDSGGQNVCLSCCLSINPGGENIRQLIFFPDGHLRYDWQYPGAILL